MSSKEFGNNKSSDQLSGRDIIRTAVKEYSLGKIDFGEFDKTLNEVYPHGTNASRNQVHVEVIECLARLNLEGRVSPDEAAERIEPLEAFSSLNKKPEN